jgi:hypothetical protein
LEKSCVKSPLINRLNSDVAGTVGFGCWDWFEITGGIFVVVFRLIRFLSSFRPTIGFNFTDVLAFVAIIVKKKTKTVDQKS